MGLLNDILDEIVDAAQGDLRDKVKQIIEQRQLKNKLVDMEIGLDKYLVENYGNELYYDVLDKYIHNGKINQDTYGDDTTSAFYYTLLCAFLHSDSKFLGEENFWNYHWMNIQRNFQDKQYDKDSIKRCFLHYYNMFKAEFGTPSDSERGLANAVKETVNENSNEILRTITDESNVIIENINCGIEKILKQGNAEVGVRQSREEGICDYNKEYQERLQDPLFLESDIDDTNMATLKNVYIEPHIDFHFGNLKRWSENSYSRILLLYGKAGIGKTSYTSWLSFNNGFTQECHILELRKCINKLDSSNSWESIKKSFKCMNDDIYQNKVLVLDGLDEVCALKGNFDGQEFIYNLNSTLKTGIGRTIKVIITSRMGYFNEIRRNPSIDIASIYWDEDSITDWCKAYCKIHKNRVSWCESFKKSYTNLEEKDKRKEVFCTPLILYICCVSQVDISKHNSVASIYDEAFNVIGARRYNEWTEVSKKEFEVNRQFTKELAFQMFLNDKLEDILGSNFVQIAKDKVVCWIQSNQSYQVKEVEFEKLFAINHFAYGKNDAIEFAHKTIGEYFTAVKLYEDYFGKIDGTIESMWRNVFNAFRYKEIPSDIMQYLVEIILNKQSDNWKERFYKFYYVGIEKQTLSTVACPELDYSTPSVALINQIQIAFRNLTWLLTGLGFNNGQFINTRENLQILVSYFYGDINVGEWKNLEALNFEGAYLRYANFSSTILCGINFHRAVLEVANFIGADLKGAHFEEAHLKGTLFLRAGLEGAHFEGAHLEGAHLQHAHLVRAQFTKSDLNGADLQGAYLEETDFERADLESSNFKFAHLERANLQLAYIKGAHFEEADLKESHLERADFERAHLERAHLEKSHFEWAHLEGAHLEGAHLEGAHLEGAHLEGAHLEGANLEGAHLEGAHLEWAHLEGAHLEGANLEGAHLEGANHTKSGSV